MPPVSSQKKHYAMAVKETLEKVKRIYDQKLSRRQRDARYLQSKVATIEAHAAEDCLQYFKGSIEDIMEAFEQSTKNTLVSFRTEIRKRTVDEAEDLPLGHKWRNYEHIVSNRIKEFTAQFRNHPLLRESISKSFQRFIVWASRYTPVYPILQDKLYLTYCECCSCGKEPPPEGFELAFVGKERNISLPFCNECLDSEDAIKVNWRLAAEMYASYSVQCERVINDITGVGWSNQGED